MKVNQLFLQSDLKAANKEMDCYIYCRDQAITSFMQADFGRAAAHHDNIARSLTELQRMRRNKVQSDQAKLILQRIKERDLEEESRSIL